MIRFIGEEYWNEVVCAILGISQHEQFRKSLPGESHPHAIQRLREEFLQTMKALGQTKMTADQIAALVENVKTHCNDKEVAEAYEWARGMRTPHKLSRRLD